MTEFILGAMFGISLVTVLYSLLNESHERPRRPETLTRAEREFLNAVARARR